MYQHDQFGIEATDLYKDICGSLIYEFSAGAYDAYFTYYSTTRIFNLKTNEMSVLVNGYALYTVTARLGAYPEVYASQTGSITMLSPCAEPFRAYIGIVPNINFDYTNTAYFSFPADMISPTLCASFVTYSCTYMDGPNIATVPDMCNQPSEVNDMWTTTISFNT